MLNITQKPASPGNFRRGRGGKAITGIVIHISTGSAVGTDAWFNDTNSHVSAHYLVLRDGTIHQYVSETDTAFHAGTIVRPSWFGALQNPHVVNEITVGIEHEGKAEDDITDEQYLSSAELVAGIAERWKLPIDDIHVIPHHAIRADKTCPGKLNVAKLIQMAREHETARQKG